MAKDSTDPTKVVFTFDKPAGTLFYYLAVQQPIVPQHIFGAAGVDQTKLETLPNTNPVGTGPVVMSQCEGTNIKFLRNQTYWQSTPDNIVPKVEEIDYPAFLSNDSANQQLHDGQDHWGGQFIQNIQSYYLDTSPNHHIWQPPTANVTMYLNIAKDPLLAQVAVRQAISFAINRNDASQLGEGGQELPSSQTGIVLPTFQGWYDQSIDTTVPGGDPAKADQVLEAAGFTKGSDGIYADAKGTKLSFTIKSVQGFSDWDAAIQTMIASLKTAGIELKQQDEDNGTLVGRPRRRQLPDRLQRRPRRPHAVLRAPQRHGQRQLLELRQVQQPDGRQPDRAVPQVHDHRRAEVDRQAAGQDHERRGAGHPGHRGRQLVPVRHHHHRRLAQC